MTSDADGSTERRTTKARPPLKKWRLAMPTNPPMTVEEAKGHLLMRAGLDGPVMAAAVTVVLGELDKGKDAPTPPLPAPPAAPDRFDEVARDINRATCDCDGETGCTKRCAANREARIAKTLREEVGKVEAVLDTAHKVNKEFDDRIASLESDLALSRTETSAWKGRAELAEGDLARQREPMECGHARANLRLVHDQHCHAPGAPGTECATCCAVARCSVCEEVARQRELAESATKVANDRRVELEALRAGPTPDLSEVHIVFDGPPGPEAGRFVDVECPPGTSIQFGEWVDRGDGFWALRFLMSSPPSDPAALARHIAAALDADLASDAPSAIIPRTDAAVIERALREWKP